MTTSLRFPFGLWLLLIAVAVPLHAQAEQTDRIIIKLAGSVRATALADASTHAGARVPAFSAAAGHDVVWLRAMSGGADVLGLPRPMPVADVQAVAAALAALPGVTYAAPDRRLFPALAPDDPRFREQWNLQPVSTIGQGNYGIDAPAAWDITTGSAVPVAVLDTGALLGHADLAGKLLPGYDFISPDSPGVFRTANDGNGRDPDPSDPGDWVTEEEAALFGCEARDSSWHGSHVAGMVAAATNNNLGVAGINWAGTILPLRVLGKCGGYTSDMVDAMRWATGIAVDGVPENPHPARIINLSLGTTGACDLATQAAINDVNARGAVVIVAAGNEGQDLSVAPSSPATCSGVVAVAASDRSGNRADYSNYGAAVAVSAPGGTTASAILSTLDGGLTAPLGDSAIGARIGTSMATAHVSGIASLVLSHSPGLTREQVSTALAGTGSVTAFPDDSSCAAGGCGTGIVNAPLALRAAAAAPPAASSGGGGGAPGTWLIALLLGYGAVRRITVKKPPTTTPASAP